MKTHTIPVYRERNGIVYCIQTSLGILTINGLSPQLAFSRIYSLVPLWNSDAIGSVENNAICKVKDSLAEVSALILAGVSLVLFKHQLGA